MNRKRKAREFARAYHSKARVEFVKSLPCAACGVVGYSENAHVPPTGEAGAGYRADYRFIAPLCGRRGSAENIPAGRYYVGCHQLFDNYPWVFEQRHPNFDPAKAAAETESAWLATQREEK